MCYMLSFREVCDKHFPSIRYREVLPDEDSVKKFKIQKLMVSLRGKGKAKYKDALCESLNLVDCGYYDEVYLIFDANRAHVEDFICRVLVPNTTEWCKQHDLGMRDWGNCEHCSYITLHLSTWEYFLLPLLRRRFATDSFAVFIDDWYTITPDDFDDYESDIYHKFYKNGMNRDCIPLTPT